MSRPHDKPTSSEIYDSTHLQRSKVDNTVNVRVLLEHLVQLLLIGDIAGVELGSLAANELDAVEDFVRGVVEVVDDNDLVVCLEEGEGSEGANVAGATGGIRELAFV